MQGLTLRNQTRQLPLHLRTNHRGQHVSQRKEHDNLRKVKTGCLLEAGIILLRLDTELTSRCTALFKFR